jgi:uncharacterized protein YndB with AHSA1/START domain
MNKIIHHKIRLNTSKQQSFEMFTKNANVQTWLAKKADIEPYLGGKYELFWDLENKEINSTLGCKITAIEENKFLCFEWKGSAQFADFMNNTDPLTHVAILFIPDSKNSTTEIHLIHSGWGSGEHWEKARMWFESVWENALNNLASKMNE